MQVISDSESKVAESKGKVSVIVRTVDRPRYLQECLQSISLQTYRDIEIVLVNDGGPPLDQFLTTVPPSVPLLLLQHPHKIGRSRAANEALRACTGRYVCFLDDDDIFYLNHIERLVRAMTELDARVVYSDALCALQVPATFEKGRYVTTSFELFYSVDFDHARLRSENFIPILCAMFDRSLVDDGLEFDEMLPVLEDWDFWISLSTRARFHHIREITCEYRSRTDGSNTVGQLEGLWQWAREYVAEKHGMKSATREENNDTEEPRI